MGATLYWQDPSGHSAVDDARDSVESASSSQDAALARMDACIQEMNEALIDMDKALAHMDYALDIEDQAIDLEEQAIQSIMDSQTTEELNASCAAFDAGHALFEVGSAEFDLAQSEFETARNRFDDANDKFNLAHNDFDDACVRFDDAIDQLNKDAAEAASAQIASISSSSSTNGDAGGIVTVNAQDKVTDFLNQGADIMEELNGFFANKQYLYLIPGGFNKLNVFINLVKTGGYFDIKNQAEWQYPNATNQIERTMTEFMYYNNRLWSAEESGNFSFGYIGVAYGYSEGFLCLGTGMYQIASGTSKWEFFTSFGDDPRDSNYIRMGYEQYKSR